LATTLLRKFWELLVLKNKKQSVAIIIHRKYFAPVRSPINSIQFPLLEPI
jgi:hypothetical protein